MEIVINIPDEVVEKIKDNILFGEDYKEVIWDITGAIANGTPFDSVIEDIITEIKAIQQEDIECDGTSDMGMVLDIIDKHISRKETQ